MSHPDVAFNIEQGCRPVSLGAVKMPEGYVLMLDSDETFYFWQNIETGKEGIDYWCRWSARRSALRHSKATAPVPPAAEGRE